MTRQPRSSAGPRRWGWIVRRSCATRFIATWSRSAPSTMPTPGSGRPSTRPSDRCLRSPTGDRRRTGRTGTMQRGEIWFAATPGGDRPVLVLTRDPVADRIGGVVVAALTRTRRDLVSELQLTALADGVPSDCVVNFDNIHTVRREAFRRPIATLSPQRLV